MKKRKGMRKCWICNDNGIVIEEIMHKNLSYEIAYRCSCKEGLKSSDSIAVVDHKMAERLAMDNYNKAVKS